MPKTDLDRLRLLTQQFELIRNLLVTTSEVGAKAAIILLESIADSLMYDICLQEFDRQAELASIQPRMYDSELRDKIRRDFSQKLGVAHDLELIPPLFNF